MNALVIALIVLAPIAVGALARAIVRRGKGPSAAAPQAEINEVRKRIYDAKTSTYQANQIMRKDIPGPWV